MSSIEREGRKAEYTPPEGRPVHGRSMARDIDWNTKSDRVGTASDNPHSLRMKAPDFRRMAAGARAAGSADDLLSLALEYEARAAEMRSGFRRPGWRAERQHSAAGQRQHSAG
jgi:hypothetical protein